LVASERATRNGVRVTQVGPSKFELAETFPEHDEIRTISFHTSW
jgi:hypothetical protein